MKIFIDTANLEQIKEINSWGILDGVTTNPTLVAKEGCDFKCRIDEICAVVDGPISAEAVSMQADGMVKEARELSKMHKNIIVKIPMTDEGLKAVKARDGINEAEQVRRAVREWLERKGALKSASRRGDARRKA